MFPQRTSRVPQSSSTPLLQQKALVNEAGGRKKLLEVVPARIVRIAAKKHCNIAILGFGTVGSSVAKILSERSGASFRLTHVFNRDVNRKKVDWLRPEVQWTENFDQVLHSDADVVVELVGGLHPAEDWIRAALKAGKSVVTANKQVIAHCGPELLDIAREHNCQLAFGGAVAGGVPVISGIQDGLSGDEIYKITGILNGTCNYILSQIESSGVPFSSALAEAQNLGYAESDPTSDVEGFDARAKLVILARIGLHANVATDSVCCHSISSVDSIDFEFAKQLGCTIRQVSSAELKGDRLLASVQPALVSLSSPLAATHGCQNLVMSTGKFGGETSFRGQGAGGDPTAVAVVSDILFVSRNRGARSNTHHVRERFPRVTSDLVARHYVRFMGYKGSGIIGVLATQFRKQGIDIQSVLERTADSRLPIAVTLQPCKTSAVEKTLRQLSRSNQIQSCVSFPILD